MLFDIHMLCKAGLVPGMRAYGNIVSVLQVFQCVVPEFKALFEAAESQALMFFIKAVGSGEKSTGCKGPSFLIVTSV